MTFEKGFQDELQKLAAEESGSVLPFLGGAGAAMVPGVASQAIGMNLVGELDKSKESLSPEDLKRLMQETVGSDIPVVPLEDLPLQLQRQLANNAAYMPPSKLLEMTTGIDTSKYPRGFITGGEAQLRNPGFMAHELGHAGAYTRSGLGRALIKSRPLAMLGLAATPLSAGVAASQELKKDETNPVARAAVLGMGGGSAAALSAGPRK